MRNYIWKTIWLDNETAGGNEIHYKYKINKIRNMTYRVGPSIAEVAVGLAGLIVGLVVVVGRGEGETTLLLGGLVMVMVRCAVEREVLLTAVGEGWTCSRER
jgi:hypothetical protein